MKVSNGKCIRRLAVRNMKTSKTRNIVAVIAIILTTILFTTVFTIAMSVIDGFEEANFRRIGTYAHGNFERLNEAQCKELAADADIKEYGIRRLVGTAEDAPFLKNNVEVSYCDETCARMMYLTPTTGLLPREGTNEAAADTKILELLGVEPVIGTEFELTFYVNREPVTRTFTLSGWWVEEELAPANHVLISCSMAEDICKNVNVQSDAQMGNYAGLYDLYYMFDSAKDVETKAEQLLNRYGYQSFDNKQTNYIGGGFNPGYAAAALNSGDIETMAIIAGIILVIIFTGYLVIHNIFRIAIANDIRRYGLLKTIGTTKRQIRKMVYTEALVLSVIAVPAGLLSGWGIGFVLTPIVIKNLNDVVILVSVNPFIFIFAAAFSIVTVFISSLKPAKIASRISPIEALRYTEGVTSGKSKTRKRKKVSMLQMAFANICRNKGKTVTTMISLMMAVLLLDITCSLCNSFDMDKYLRDVKADFMVSHANYFHSNGHIFSDKRCITEDTIKTINDTGMVTESGAAYACGAEKQTVYQYVPKEVYMDTFQDPSDESTDYFLEHEVLIDGRYEDNADVLGMDDFCLNQLSLVEGDISKLYEGGNYIAAVYHADDFENAETDSHWAKVGEHVTIRYVEEYAYYNPDTGHVYTEEELENLSASEPVWRKSVVYHDVDYEVCATVVVPKKMSYRYYMFDQYVLPADNLKKNLSGTNIMYYAYNVADENTGKMEQFLSDYTETVMPDYDYESKQTLSDKLDSSRRMYLILGGILSFIIGIIGVLNFLNVNLTNMAARKKEFAMLQSIGMTGKQLKQMLVMEGLLYALSSIVLACLMLLLFGPVLENGMENMIWFVSYQPTWMPVLCILPFFVFIGIIIPILVYRIMERSSIVERLREGE